MSIIAFDFDGTITKENLYPAIGELRPVIKQCINQLVKEGHKIIIFTCRSSTTKNNFHHYKIMVDFLQENNIQYHTINANINPSVEFNPVKPYWDILVDDTILGWNNAWTGDEIYQMIQKQLN